jgi:hypothetical protein
MLNLALCLLLAAAPPSAQQAKSLAASKSWDDLYLAFSAADPSRFSAEDRRAIAAALHKGCEALDRSDAVMAYSLADKAVAFDESAGALLCLARTARASDQRSASEQALRKGLSSYPDRTAAFALLLGQQLLEEKDPDGAVEVLEQVPKRAKEHKAAQALLKKARAEQADEREARKQARAVERRLEKGQGSGVPDVRTAKGGSRGATASTGGSLTYESGESGGMRTRANSRFVIKYFKNDRDFGQRADYEGAIVATLDEAYEASHRFLGEARTSPVDVVLYTREEFAAHFSAGYAQRVAGLYFGDSIRINDAAELSRQNKATLVHEYIHAVVDDLTGRQAARLPRWLNEGLAEYVEWRYLGSDEPPGAMKAALKQAARSNRLPRLEQMDRGAPINEANPAMAYAFSACTVRLLLGQGGASKLLDFIRDVGSGQSFEEQLQQRYGRSVAELQEQVRSDLQ